MVDKKAQIYPKASRKKSHLRTSICALFLRTTKRKSDELGDKKRGGKE